MEKSPALKRLAESVRTAEKSSRSRRKSLGITQHTDTDKAEENDGDDSPECPCFAVHLIALLCRAETLQPLQHIGEILSMHHEKD